MKFYDVLRLMWMKTEGMPIIRWIAFTVAALTAWHLGLLGFVFRLIIGVHQ